MEAGKKLIAESGLPVITADDLGDAAQKRCGRAANPKSQTQIQSNIQTKISKSRSWPVVPPNRLISKSELFSLPNPFVHLGNIAANLGNSEDFLQLVRASGPGAANWIEADESMSKKDFLVRAKICRKEA